MVRVDFKVKCLLTYRDSIINEACKDKKSYVFRRQKTEVKSCILLHY